MVATMTQDVKMRIADLERQKIELNKYKYIRQEKW